MRFFISYSRSVKTELRPVIDLLRAAGHKVWWDADIPEMADWWATILDEIEKCQVCVFVVSEKSVQSPYCLAELGYATDRNRPILPFVIDDHNGYRIPPEVTPMRNQWFEYDGDPARTLARIQAACDQIDWKRHTDIQKARPTEPNKGSGSLVKEFQQAVTLAENGHFDEAIKRFRNVSSLDFREWGDECQQWIARLQSYRDIAELAEHKATLVRAQRKWADYLKAHDAEFDPLDVCGKLAKATPHIEVVAPPEPGTRWVDPKGVPMVYVPAGKFLMGSTGQLPQHEQTIKHAFWLDLTPVTNAAYAQFIADGAYQNAEFWTPAGWEWAQSHAGPKNYGEQFNTPQQPRVGVTWFEAYAYCRWRGGRLPTEAQWEWAARGPENRQYPWGNRFVAANMIWGKNSGGKTAAVGEGIRTTGRSWVNALDMSGNVWEWCSSLYQAYPFRADDERENIDSGNIGRVLRGGSWDVTDTISRRAASRIWFQPSSGSSRFGFRFVRSFEP